MNNLGYDGKSEKKNIALAAELWGVDEKKILAALYRGTESRKSHFVAILTDGRKQVFTPAHVREIQSGERPPFISELKEHARAQRAAAGLPILGSQAEAEEADAADVLQHGSEHETPAARRPRKPRGKR